MVAFQSAVFKIQLFHLLGIIVLLFLGFLNFCSQVLNVVQHLIKCIVEGLFCFHEEVIEHGVCCDEVYLLVDKLRHYISLRYHFVLILLLDRR